MEPELYYMNAHFAYNHIIYILMATLKATVKSKRKDGMYVVYIRFVHNRKVSYQRTSWLVTDKSLSRNKKEILDPFVIQQTSKLINQYYNILNRIDTLNWTVYEIVDYIQKGKEGIFPFPMDRLSFPDSKVEEQISHQHQTDLQSCHVGIQ